MSEKETISQNMNRLHTATDGTFFDAFHELSADIFCIQESKLQKGRTELGLPGCYDYWNYAGKKGYPGVTMFIKEKPMNVSHGLDIPKYDKEGRVITLEFPDYYVLTCYTPSSQNELKRLDYRMEWEDAFFAYIKGLDQRRPLIYYGDLNVAHERINPKNSLANRRSAGFTDEGREKTTHVSTNGLVDSFRYFHPEEKDAYSWWSYRVRARGWNVGWRIDYFIVSERLRDRIQGASIHSRILRSDHCLMKLKIDL